MHEGYLHTDNIASRQAEGSVPTSQRSALYKGCQPTNTEVECSVWMAEIG